MRLLWTPYPHARLFENSEFWYVKYPKLRMKLCNCTNANSQRDRGLLPEYHISPWNHNILLCYYTICLVCGWFCFGKISDFWNFEKSSHDFACGFACVPASFLINFDHLAFSQINAYECLWVKCSSKSLCHAGGRGFKSLPPRQKTSGFSRLAGPFFIRTV